MSDQITETNEETTETTEAAENATAAGEVLEALSDVRVEDVGGFTEALSHLIAVGKSLVRSFQTFESRTDEVAEARMQIRPFMILPSGLPDWAGTSQGYKAAVESAEFALYVKLGPEAKRRLDQNVRKAVERKFRLPAVVAWILEHENGFGEEYETFKADAAKVLGSPSAALVQRVQFHFDNSKVTKDKALQIPDTFPQFQRAKKTGEGNVPTPGPGQDQPKSPLGTFEAAVGGLKQIRPDYSTSALLRGVSDLSARLVEAKGEIRGRVEIETMLDRVEAIAMLTAKYLRGEANEAETAKLATLYWTKDDTPKSE